MGVLAVNNGVFGAIMVMSAANNGLCVPGMVTSAANNGVLVTNMGMFTVNNGLLATIIGMFAVDNGVFAPNIGMLAANNGLFVTNMAMFTVNNGMCGENNGQVVIGAGTNIRGMQLRGAITASFGARIGRLVGGDHRGELNRRIRTHATASNRHSMPVPALAKMDVPRHVHDISPSPASSSRQMV
jgi:hypothetical protein